MSQYDAIRSVKESISEDCLTVYPAEARLDVSSRCQLDCPLCPTARGKGRSFIGRGVMPVADFVEFIDCNPRIRIIELGNSGEVFLNPDLPAILRSAAERGVSTRVAEGANLNYASEEALEALVQYGVTVLRVAVDGATEETYRKYRVGGDLKKVLRNVRKINEFKKQYKSSLPLLILQCILFPHNEHEIKKIAVMARAMGMDIQFKLNEFNGYPPLQNHTELTERLGYFDRDSYREKTGKIYMRDLCLQLWRSPQINWDGRLIGCSVNTTVSYAGYALGGAFEREINNEHIQYARKMLMGIAPPREDIPCTVCDSYADFRKHDQWFTPEEIKADMERRRKKLLENDEH